MRSVALWGWFQGELREGRAALVSANGHALLLATDGEAFAGEGVTREGVRLAFRVEPATGDAGVWRAQGLLDGLPALAGWVLLDDGRQRGSGQLGGVTVTVAPLNTGSPAPNGGSGSLAAFRINPRVDPDPTP